MSNSAPLNTCGCCDPDRDQPTHYNPPGQPALSYRIGTHPSFLRRMISRLPRWQIPDGYHAGRQPLNKLTTRAADDPAIALLDAWATVADVLAFYQERIANENYLRTATERRSVLELARAIGYELNPGVAAETYLAFTVDEADTSPETATVPAGTQVLSIPEAEGELPQTFETSAEFTAQKMWNKLQPRLTQPQMVTLATTQLHLQGSALDLDVGDLLLLVEETTTQLAVKRIESVETIAAGDVTIVTLVDLSQNIPTAAPGGSEQAPLPSFTLPSLTEETKPALTETAVTDLFAAKSVTESQLQAALKLYDWQGSDLLTFLQQRQTNSPDNIKVYALREKAGIFGHNAPHYNTLPPDNEYSNLRGQFHNWDNPDWEVWKDSLISTTDSSTAVFVGTTSPRARAIEQESIYIVEDTSAKYYQDADLYLERPLEGIVPNSWVILTQPQTDPKAFKVKSAEEASVAGFTLSAKATALQLYEKNGNDDIVKSQYSQFKVRKTTAYVKSEVLTLADIPLSDTLDTINATLELNEMVIGLQKGQAVVVSGERSTLKGVSHSEIKLLNEITHDDLHTVLHFTAPLTYPYLLDTVTINANVVKANHGETVAGEALGSGAGSQKNQRFRLKKSPLTHISAVSAGGAVSTLKVWVNGVAWRQVPSLYGLDGNSKSYLVRIDNEANASVIFGDGVQGARLPTGLENVVATYRSGIGTAGEVGAGSLTLLKTRPLGIRGVTNPLAASGAADPESLADARHNAPLTVLTLDRIVSLQDYEDFARAFAGIGKAQATALWNGETQLVHITIADANGDTIQTTDTLFQNLLDTINAARDPLHEVRLGGFLPLSFNVQARVLIDPAYKWANVKPEIENVLLAAFAFEQRAFGQSVTAAEIVALCHTIAGVTAVDLDSLYIENIGEAKTNGVSLASILPAQTARWDENRRHVQPADLLLINSYGLDLTEMTV